MEYDIAAITSAGIYIPLDTSDSIAAIAPGSGIVGVKYGNGTLLYYEGNLYGAENMRDYEARIISAAGRLFVRYPTVARIYLPHVDMSTTFHQVGVIDRQYQITYTSDEHRAKAADYGLLNASRQHHLTELDRHDGLSHGKNE